VDAFLEVNVERIIIFQSVLTKMKKYIRIYLKKNKIAFSFYSLIPNCVSIWTFWWKYDNAWVSWRFRIATSWSIDKSL